MHTFEEKISAIMKLQDDITIMLQLYETDYDYLVEGINVFYIRDYDGQPGQTVGINIIGESK